MSYYQLIFGEKLGLSLSVAFAMSSAVSVPNFQLLGESFPSIGKSENKALNRRWPMMRKFAVPVVT